MIERGEDYAFARPSLTDKKLRALELRAGMQAAVFGIACADHIFHVSQELCARLAQAFELRTIQGIELLLQRFNGIHQTQPLRGPLFPIEFVGGIERKQRFAHASSTPSICAPSSAGRCSGTPTLRPNT